MTDHMNAVLIEGFGGSDVLREGTLPIPSIADDEVLVRVRASAVNPVDVAIRQGMYDFAHHPFPMVLGWDFSGTVEQVGASVTDLRPGDAVYGRPDLTRDGSYAEYIAVKAAHLAIAPKSLPLEQAAALPLAVLTAWQGLFDLGQLDAGQTVLVIGGAGGVGGLAVQLAAHSKARVVATATGTGIDLARSLGADDVIDYRGDDLASRGRFADVVLDTVGGDAGQDALRAVVPGGRWVSTAGAADEGLAAELGVKTFSFIVDSNGPRLAEVAELVDAGALRPVVQDWFPLQHAALAHDRVAAGHLRGKVMLDHQAR
ncbi:NADP-dependent oxidoreductase [Promicromonospora thailandica]|uniref:NADPH:quinone reductase n=1 Tax=Promicromonospora thailandica TaxID=765201 RepID=A0A9X2G1W0_9MICO|nr:NADP-dependent oxidoreductase [Promicromonospora thailandica]MCP2265525.1 NADPH:quinone reductase [Promicromonospora thailandica]BFF17088.1 NADP-dependent oxidoreductase [Promicromonospora thailandica]